MNVGVGEVEDTQDGFKVLSIHIAVYPTAFAEGRSEHLLRQASHFQVQLTGNLKHAVPHRFEGQSLCIHRGKEQVVRVLGVQTQAGSSVGLGEKDFANGRFDFPSLVTKARGEVIKKLRMGGGVAHQPEIAWGPDNALADQVAPNSIDHDPGGQGVMGRQNGFGQLQATASLGVMRSRLTGRGKGNQKPSRNLISAVAEVPAKENSRFAYFLVVLKSHGSGRGTRVFGSVLFHLCP